MSISAAERRDLGIESFPDSYKFPIEIGRVEIAYSNEQGYRSCRVIRPRSYSRARDGREFIRAHCEKRGKELTFRIDRIESVHSVGARSTAVTSSTIRHQIVSSPPAPRTTISRPTPAFHQAASNHRTKARDATTSPSKNMASSDHRNGPRTAVSSSIIPASSSSRKQSKKFLGSFLGKAAAAVLVFVFWGEFIQDKPPETITKPSIVYRITPQATNSTYRSASTASRVALNEASAKLSVAARNLKDGNLSVSTSRSGGSSTASSDTQTRNHSHRGISITEVIGRTSVFRVSGIDESFQTIEKARTAANVLVFAERTGITDQRLIALYLRADEDRNGYMSWPELASFQRRLDSSYRYSANGTAIRPDEFLAQGGGDCEDWSLVTAGLCRFWGWETYVGSIGPESGTGHAVALIRMNQKPNPRYAYYHFNGNEVIGGRSVLEGYYVPVDYGYVGKLSSAVNRGWRLRGIYSPESIYGKIM